MGSSDWINTNTILLLGGREDLIIAMLQQVLTFRGAHIICCCGAKVLIQVKHGLEITKKKEPLVSLLLCIYQVFLIGL